MGKLTIKTIRSDKNLRFSVYFDDSFQGEYNLGDAVTLEVKSSCYVSLKVDGIFCDKRYISADENTELVASYDEIYGGMLFLSVARGDVPGGFADKNNSGGNASYKASQNKLKEHYSAPAHSKNKPYTMFRKLSEEGDWVHRAFLFIFILMIIGTLIAFFILICEDLVDVAFIVLGSGAGATLLFYLEYILAGYFYFAAKDKGYKDLSYLFFSWVFPLIGHLLVVALPDRGKGKNH